MGVKVITDSTSYLPRSLRQSLDIGVVSLSSELEGVSYADDAEDYSAFYTAIRQPGVFPTTSQPSLQAMSDAIESRVAEGHAVVGVFISQLMSGTYSSALLARDMVLERHPDAAIEIVDSQSNSMELGLAVIAAARKAAEGAAVEEVLTAATDMMGRTRFLFVPMTLEYLRRGGRIGAASALLGSLLQVKPVLTVVAGRTDTFAKVRTLSKAWGTIAEAFASDVRDKGGLAEAYIHHIDDPGAGTRFAELLAPIAGRMLELVPIGPAIGTHVGPGTVGVVYCTNDPIRKSG
jgi:DegV family protein with EDD domain